MKGLVSNMDINELRLMQELPLDIKIAKTKLRIEEALNRYTHNGLYISLSGGKDSMVLHHVSLRYELARYGQIMIQRVYCDTGLEYPEVRQMVLNLQKEYGDRVIKIIRPDIPFTKVVENYGYPIVSKEQSQFIHQFRTAKSEKTKDTRWNGNKWGRGKISEKWKYLVNADFNVSDKCCDIMKKKPFKKFEKETGKIPIIGKMAIESSKRTQDYIKQGGCNAFNNKRPKSEPIGFWKESDVLEYIMKFNLKDELLADVYGDIVVENGKYKTTKCDRTGCMFCAYGLHMDKNDRFVRLKETHPNYYEYCMRGGEYKEGKWIPKNGLGMRKVLKEYVNKEY